jgi:DNA-binding XRE family transcriptional regulator
MSVEIKTKLNLQMSQVEFAKLIGVDRRTIMNYEQGKKDLYKKLIRISKLSNGALGSIPDKETQH